MDIIECYVLDILIPKKEKSGQNISGKTKKLVESNMSVPPAVCVMSKDIVPISGCG